MRPGIIRVRGQGRLHRREDDLRVPGRPGHSPVWVKILVVSAAACGSLWVALLPTPEGAARAAAEVSDAERKDAESA